MGDPQVPDGGITRSSKPSATRRVSYADALRRISGLELPDRFEGVCVHVLGYAMIAIMHSGVPVYQARYGWSRTSLSLLAGGLLLISPVLLGWQAVVIEIVCIPCGVFLLANVLSALIGRPVAFRADEWGVAIGGNPIPFWYRASTRFVPWTQIEQVRIWHRDFPLTVGGRTLCNLNRLRYVGLVRRPNGPPLSERGLLGSYANRPVYKGPSDIMAGAARVVSMWKLDRNRLELAVSTFAPGVAVIELDAPTRARKQGRHASGRHIGLQDGQSQR